MGLLHERNVDIFSDAGSAKNVNTTFTAGSWISSENFDVNVVVIYKLSGVAPTALKSKVTLSLDDGTNIAGVTEQTNSVSGGEEVIADSVKNLVGVDLTDSHIFTVFVPAGFRWRVEFLRVGGSSSTQLLGKANIIKLCC